VFMVISATMPGLGGLVGARELDRAARVRNETMVLSWLVSVGAGATIIVWLPPFLDLWVGEKYDAGTPATVLICVMVTQLALIRVDANVIDLTLRVRAKVLLGLFSALLGAGLGILLAGRYGIPGLVTGFILGRLPLTIAYPVLVGRLLERPHAVDARAVWRPALASVLLGVLAVAARPLVGADGWFSLIVLGSLSAGALLLLAYVLGLTATQRRSVRSRLTRVVRLR
jgi:O-antigen/teichoic acid export membrane protein